MKVSLLVIGNEILNGKVSDANTRFLAEFLLKNHFDFDSVLIVRDEEADIHRGLTKLFESSSIIITSGGLGPTRDDITKAAIGNYFKRKMLYSAESEKAAMASYDRIQRVWPGGDHEYTKLPEGFKVLTNSTGMAPSFCVEDARGIVLSAPGVPKEFGSIIEDHLLATLAHLRKNHQVLDLVTVRTKKIPEEKIFAEVDATLWDKLSFYGDVSSLPNLMGVDICVKIKSPTPAEAENKRSAVLNVLKNSPIHQHVWNYGPESLEEVILSKARDKKVTFGFAESATGGLCSHRITGVAGSSTSFMGAVICYDEKVKKEILGVSENTLRDHGVVSIETAKEMASGLAQKLHLDIAISITGIAGPGGGTKEKPVGTVAVGISKQGQSKAEMVKLFGDREQLKNRFAQLALFTLLEELENIA